MKKILFTILARGGSKGVPNKNINPLLGKPLIHYTLEHAKMSGISPYIAMSSDSEKILEIASQISGVEAIRRPGEFSNDTVTKLPGIRHAVEVMEKKLNFTFDLIIDLDPTSPLREPRDITEALAYFNSSTFDSLITGCTARRNPYFNLIERTSDQKAVLSKRLDHPIKCRQDAPECFDMNGSIYIWKRKTLFEEERVIGPNTGLFEMTAEKSVDIDHPIDFKLVELLLKERMGAKA